MEDWLLPAVLVVLTLEIFLSGVWVGFYFRNGLPLFQRRVQIVQTFAHIPEPKQLEELLKRKYMPPLVFRKLDLYTYAFREKLFELSLFSYTPVMHGLLSFHPEKAEVVVTGFANWFVFAFCFAVVILSREWLDPLFIVFPAAIVGAIYVFQSRRYAAVADIAVEQCTS